MKDKILSTEAIGWVNSTLPVTIGGAVTAGDVTLGGGIGASFRTLTQDEITLVSGGYTSAGDDGDGEY